MKNHKGIIWGMAAAGGFILFATARDSFAWWPSPWESWWLDNPWMDSPLGGGYPGYRDYSWRRRHWDYGYDDPSGGYRPHSYRYDYYGDYPNNWYWDNGRYDRSRPPRDDWGYRGYDYGRDYYPRDYGYDPSYRNYSYPSPNPERNNNYSNSNNYYDRDIARDRPYSGYGDNSWDNSRNNHSWGNNSGSTTGDSWNNNNARSWNGSNN